MRVGIRGKEWEDPLFLFWKMNSLGWSLGGKICIHRKENFQKKLITERPWKGLGEVLNRALLTEIIKLDPGYISFFISISYFNSKRQSSIRKFDYVIKACAELYKNKLGSTGVEVRWKFAYIAKLCIVTQEETRQEAIPGLEGSLASRMLAWQA